MPTWAIFFLVSAGSGGLVWWIIHHYRHNLTAMPTWLFWAGSLLVATAGALFLAGFIEALSP